MADEQLTSFLVKVFLSKELLEDFKENGSREALLKAAEIDDDDRDAFIALEPIGMARALRNNQGGKPDPVGANRLARQAAKQAQKSAKEATSSAKKAASSAKAAAASAKKAARKGSGKG